MAWLIGLALLCLACLVFCWYLLAGIAQINYDEHYKKGD